MSIRILTQKAMQMARGKVRFCYLCGAPFELGEKTAVEHVVARESTDYQATGAEAWLVTLPVHPECDRRLKKPNDDELIAMQRAHSRWVHDVPVSNRQTVLKRLRAARAIPSQPDSIAVEAGPVFQSIDATVRGMHTALYGTFLPADTKHRTCAPTPAFSVNSRRPVHVQLARERTISDIVMRALLAAHLSGEWDGITAWGGMIRYRCAWYVPEEGREVMCSWGLATPEALKWSSHLGNEAVPWRGTYRCATLPAGASVLTDLSAQHLVLEQRRRQQLPFLLHLLRSAGT
jgi:hypothetical protein